jgi:hypothetical protein
MDRGTVGHQLLEMFEFAGATSADSSLSLEMFTDSDEHHPRIQRALELMKKIGFVRSWKYGSEEIWWITTLGLMHLKFLNRQVMLKKSSKNTI